MQIVKYFLLFILLPLLTNATQYKIVVDDQEIEGNISTTQLNRITIAEDRIKSVKKNEGEFSVISDSETGDIFIKLNNVLNLKPINMFLITEKKDTYKLTLFPANISAQQIFISNKNIKTQTLDTLSFKKDIIKYYKSLYKGIIPQGFDQQKVKFTQMILPNISLQIRKIYKNNEYEIEQGFLQNNSNQDIEISEDMLLEKNIIAIKIASNNLEKTSQTPIYIFKRVLHEK